MKEHIQKILEMNKSGALTDEQAALLIEELFPASEAKSGPRRAEGFGQTAKDIMETIASSMRGRSSVVTGVFPSDLKENDVSMSRVDVESGEGSVFKDNAISMSEVSDFELKSSQFTSNTVSSSRL